MLSAQKATNLTKSFSAKYFYPSLICSSYLSSGYVGWEWVLAGAGEPKLSSLEACTQDHPVLCCTCTQNIGVFTISIHTLYICLVNICLVTGKHVMIIFIFNFNFNFNFFLK